MILLLNFLIFGHFHVWEQVGQGRWSSPSTGAEGPRYVCKCKSCGKFKAFDL